MVPPLSLSVNIISNNIWYQYLKLIFFSKEAGCSAAGWPVQLDAVQQNAVQLDAVHESSHNTQRTMHYLSPGLSQLDISSEFPHLPFKRGDS